MSIEVFNNPGVAHAVGNSTGAVSVSGDTIIETDTLPENELARAIPGLTKYMIEWKSPKSPESESEARHTDGAMPQVFDPEQALRDYANGAFLNASSFTELPQPGLNPNPLRGLPSRFTIDGEPIDFGPNLRIRRASETYCRLAGIPVRFPIVYAKLDKVRSTAIAHLYEDMIPTPTDPTTQAAYRALCTETLAQWQIIKATGLHVEYELDAAHRPYPNPRKAILDIYHNNHLFVTPTRSAYGDVPFQQDPHNPLLVETSEQISGMPALVNDIFRIVHDYFGHAKEGLGFRAEGEENAWRGHAVMYSPLARRAMTTELRGQNSWINFGPYGFRNRRVGMGETRFAVQKLALLPEWCAWEGVED